MENGDWGVEGVEGVEGVGGVGDVGEGRCKEEGKWLVATKEKSDDTALHTARIMSSNRKWEVLTQ
ncbi:uncharacterized protein N7477_005581 [Penicillium maclennaniae]|uniref:uncharacterized protein n=1 Tax=Penicillium maclennaniae TaxID=1343394 RepID=UPI00253FB329|nr:uncharacterized protein N7477_005581 [Penicillium maclennaniae]KAJ5670218.1 hypothetical protein N7477_005581 [Penicillium maclennaniae]